MAINLVLGITAAVGVVWDVYTGQLGSMDGNFILVVCLLMAAMFLGGFISSIRNGGMKAAFGRSKGLDSSKEDAPKSAPK